ncbi:hypothetical protein [Oceanobacillus sp. FSL H7-0719]|uniref:hypothetical protein n=1 Tax=Oceanobacillus sp. FSL H7-0719 TaxID=2954507 RepID=UPI0032476627
MRQPVYGLALFIFLILPPVVTLAESIMAIHMHMQMPLFMISGMLMAPFFQKRFPKFFDKWNSNGIPGILLFMVIVIYWMIPRTMDEALTITAVEIFKFVSLPFLAGVPLRDSWKKIGIGVQNTVFIILSVTFGLLAWLYIASPTQLCNNYLIVEQKTLGWGFVFLSACIFFYFVQTLFIKIED